MSALLLSATALGLLLDDARGVDDDRVAALDSKLGDGSLRAVWRRHKLLVRNVLVVVLATKVVAVYLNHSKSQTAHKQRPSQITLSVGTILSARRNSRRRPTRLPLTTYLTTSVCPSPSTLHLTFTRGCGWLYSGVISRT